MSVRDVIIVGAGPSGLATAIAAKHFNLDYLVLEQGSLVDAIARFPINMVFFTTPELLEIGGIPLTTPFEKPTRAEALRYYRKVVDTFQLQVSLVRAGHGRCDRPALPMSRLPSRPRPSAARRAFAKRATSCWRWAITSCRTCSTCPAKTCRTSRTSTRKRTSFYRQRVVIVGGKNSAAEAALEIHRAGGHVTMVHRGPGFGDSVKYWVKPDIENRVKEGSIAAHFNAQVAEIRPTEVVLDTGRDDAQPKRCLLLTGYRADPEFMRRIGVEINRRDAEPKYNAETYETNVPGLFVAGGQVAGKRTGTVFIENGRFHGEQIAKAIAGRSR